MAENQTSQRKVRDLHTYTSCIYVHTFRSNTGFYNNGPLPGVTASCGSCSSGQCFACSFLQIPPRDGHPCGPQRRLHSGQHHLNRNNARQGATRHAWCTNKNKYPVLACFPSEIDLEDRSKVTRLFL
ncbi:hypothetical protein DYI41_16815 [Marinobacter salarius]|nr:hypothetical protein [Marinobacter salarius]